MSNEIQSLVEQLQKGRCVLCAGSRLVGDSSYRTVVERLIQALPPQQASDAMSALDNRPLAAAGWVRRRLGDRFAASLDQVLDKDASSPVLQTLGGLPFRAVITTTYSDVFERAFAQGGSAPKVYTPSDVAELKKDGKVRYVWKLLGDPQKPGSVVFSAEDVQGALADGVYRNLAHELYRSRSFLFVGFDAKDTDLAILLERVLAGARGQEGVEHFAVLPGVGQVEREELWAAYRIHVLDESDVTKLAATLKDAVGEITGPPLPDDLDFDGWFQLLTEDPERNDALEHLDRVEQRLRGDKDHDHLIELLLGRVGIEHDGKRRAEMLLELARLFEHEVGDLGKAFTALLAAYKEDPRPHTWDELERLASATGTWTELLAELTEIVPSLPENDRGGAWLRIARLYGERLGHLEYALTSVNEAVRLFGSPGSESVPAAKEAQALRLSLLGRAEKWRELADALSESAEIESDALKRSELYAEQADVLEARLGDGAGAAKSYRKALEAQPGAVELRGALEALLRRRGDWKALCDALTERAALTSGEEAMGLHREAAEILAEQLDDRRAAIERYEEILKAQPHDLPTLRALERLYEQEGRHDPLLANLAAQAEAVESDRERSALYRRLATEWEETPSGARRAAEYLEKLLELDARSEDALRSLERIYRVECDWPALIEALRRHAQIVPPALRAELLSQVGTIADQELHDATQAIDAYAEAERLLPNHAEAQRELSRLYEKAERWSEAIELAERRAGSAELKAQKVELFHAAGELSMRVGDAKGAEARFARALEVDATHVPSMTGLVEIYRKNGEFLRAAKLLVEAVPHEANRLERTRLLVEAGEIFDGLEDKKRAIELYLDALAVDPEHVEAGERVAELLWKDERYADLVPILEMLTRKTADDKVQLERLARLGMAASTLGEAEKAQKAYTRAAELDPTHLEAQRGRAAWHFGRDEWEPALDALKQILVHHANALPVSERVELHYQLGVCEKQQGRADKASQMFQRALQLDPTHRPSLLAQVEGGEARPESIIDAKNALLQTAAPEEKIRLLGEIGDLWAEKLSSWQKALDAYREALDLRPEDQRLLHKCLDVYVEQKQWAQAVEMLDRLIGVEKVAQVRAKYRHAAGLICRDELGRPEQSAKLLGEALDDDPSADRSAEALETLLRERQEWKELARFYRKTIKRLGGESSNVDGDGKNGERLRVWSSLGELCLDKLGERESAIAALEVALTLDRGNMKRHEQLAELYVSTGPDHAEKAITQHQILLRTDKSRVASYRALKQVYAQQNQRDKAAAAAYALTFLKKGDADDQRLAAEQKQKPFAWSRRSLNDELWQRIQHPDEDRALTALFSALAPMLGISNAQTHKQANLNRKDALESNETRGIGRYLRKSASALGIAFPEAYVRPDQKEPVQFVACVDKNMLVPVLLLGQPLLQEKRPEREIAFELGRKLAHLRPERIMRYLLPQPAQLQHIIEAAITLGSGIDGVGDVHKTVEGMKRALAPVVLEQVAAVGRKLRGDGSRPEALALSWLQHSDLTGSRAGFLLAGDLETSARIIAAEPAAATTLPPMQRLLDLVWSSVTEDLFSAKKHLGVA
jgi:tetratricopeptide (TPR) repeat protein